MSYSQQASQRSFEVLRDAGFRHLHNMWRALEIIWSKRPENPDEGFLFISDGDIADAIVSFVTDFGHVSTLLFDDSPKRASENSAVYRMRTERIKKVASFFDGIDTSVFKDRRIRNRHFHADEHVSKFFLAHPAAGIVEDIAMNSRNAIKYKHGVLFLRVYEYSSDLLLHLDAEFDVKTLYETSLLMSERITATQAEAV